MSSEDLGSPLRATGRICIYGLFTLVLLPVQTAAVLMKWPLRTTLPRWYHKHCCRILGIRVVRRGRPAQESPVLFAANHCSYLDIIVLGALLPASFVAKSEVAKWPLFGLLAKLQRSVFVDRRPRRTAEQRDFMAARLEAGDNLILFPEGTSGDGNRVLPFKSSLLSVAELRPQGRPLTVQPVSITYTMLDGLPLGRYLRPFFAWYGDMELAGHLWQWVGLGRLTVVVRFHQPVDLTRFASRKELSEYCYLAASQGMADALAGRRRPASWPRIEAPPVREAALAVQDRASEGPMAALEAPEGGQVG